jgi:hypothetical protein
MFKFARTIATAAFTAFMLLALAGCGDAPPTTYAVKAYSGGQVVSTFDASSFSSGDGRITANMPNNRQNIVGGTFSVRRSDARANDNSAAATKYVAELYSGGKAVESVNASSISTGSGKVLLRVNGNVEQIVFGGTYVLRHIGANLEGKSDGSKYKVTAYSDGVLIGTWYADSYTTGDQRITLRVNGISEALIIGGNYVVEQFR